jgi:HAD superfamily hydrolase (TIGR01509 family)
MPIKGLIFDFDGLILDTEVPGFTAWMELFNAHGFPFTHEDWKKAIGTGPSAYDPAEHLYKLLGNSGNVKGFQDATYQRAMKILEEESILPGVLPFIQIAKKANLCLSIASSSSRSWVVDHLTRLEILEYFKVVCTSDDVNQVKPDPELYTLTLSKIGLTASEVIVFEDSPNGISAAKAAGIYCIAVPNAITQTMDLSKADRICQSFLEILLEDFSHFN